MASRDVRPVPISGWSWWWWGGGTVAPWQFGNHFVEGWRGWSQSTSTSCFRPNDPEACHNFWQCVFSTRSFPHSIPKKSLLQAGRSLLFDVLQSKSKGTPWTSLFSTYSTCISLFRRYLNTSIALIAFLLSCSKSVFAAWYHLDQAEPGSPADTNQDGLPSLARWLRVSQGAELVCWMGIKRHDGGIVVAALLILSMTAALLKEKHII